MVGRAKMRAELGREDPSALLEKSLHVAQSRRPGAEAHEKNRCQPNTDMGQVPLPQLRQMHTPLGIFSKAREKGEGKGGEAF